MMAVAFKGGHVTLYVEGQKAGEGRVDRTMPFIFSGDEGMDVGTDTGLRVTEDEPKGQFTGEICWVQLDLGIEDYDHFLTPEERYRAAMMWQ
jgi:arylsulfatase